MYISSEDFIAFNSSWIDQVETRFNDVLSRFVYEQDKAFENYNENTLKVEIND